MVHAYLAAENAGDAAAMAAILADGVAPAPLDQAVSYEVFTEALTDNGSLVFVEGKTGSGAGVMRRFHVVQGRIEGVAAWVDAG